MQNCGRIYFPRSYPEDSQHGVVERLYQFMLPNHPFFEEVALKINEVPSDEIDRIDAGIERKIRGLMVNDQTWRTEESTRGSIYTMEDFIASTKALETFVRTAALIEMNRKVHLDPVVTAHSPIGNSIKNA